MGFLPAFFGINILFRIFSTFTTKFSLPSGLPVRSCLLICSAIWASTPWLKNSAQLSTNSFKPPTLVSLSSLPDKYVPALLHRYCSGRLHNLHLTGFIAIYRTAAIRYLLSITNDENLPCHKCPRQSSRKFILRVYRR